jgi:DNA repair protein RadD
MIFTEGFDEPSASCLVLARPTKLLTTYRQMAGRVLRPHPGKIDARILDHSGAVFRHGYPDDEIEWALYPDEKAINKSAAARANGNHHRELTTCPRCDAVRMQGEPCEVCDWKPNTKPQYLEVAAGDLGKVHRDRSINVLGQEELTVFSEFKSIFLEKRRRNPSIKPGYPAAIFKQKFGRWPPRNWEGASPIEPSPAVRAWVRAQDIAYARSRAPR